MNPIDDIYIAYWENEKDLPAFLEDIASQMRRGDYSISSECLVLTKSMDDGMITVSRWGENDGLTSADSLMHIAELSRTTA